MDLSTKYLGLTLQNPLVASASPLSRTLDGIRRLEDAGAGAVVLYSLFQEQIAWETVTPEAERAKARRSRAAAPIWATEPVGPEEYLDLISLARQAVSIPVIGSLNGTAAGDWTRYARLIEGAGAQALELNLYFLPTDGAMSSADVEQQYLDVVREIRRNVTFPIAVKIGPYFSSLPNMAQRLRKAGADGLVLFNRFYGPDFDIDEKSVSGERSALSSPEDLFLPLRWIALLYGSLDCDLALTSGVHDHEAVLKALMAGADVAMMASTLLEHGVARLSSILSDMVRWMQVNDYESLSDIRGMLCQQRSAAESASLERAGYVRAIHSVLETA